MNLTKARDLPGVVDPTSLAYWDDIHGTLARLADQGIEPEKPPYSVREGGSLLAFVKDPDGYRVEILEMPRA